MRGSISSRATVRADGAIVRRDEASLGSAREAGCRFCVDADLGSLIRAA